MGQNDIKLPMIAPPAPEAAAFARYGTIPVDYSTGVPKISIPIYTIKTGQLEFPLSFSYHASGNKVSDIASSVGLGWVLNASGVVTQVGMGGHIDGTSGCQYKSSAEIDARKNISNLISPNNILQRQYSYYQIFSESGGLDDIVNGYADTQSDKYTYNFNGHSGGFRDDFTIPGEQMILMPYYPIQVIKGSNSVTIIDENGTSYVFDQIEVSNVYYTNSRTYSYYLSSMTSLDGVDKITFEYEILPGYKQKIPTQSLSYGREGHVFDPGNCDTYGSAPNAYLTRNTQEIYYSNIRAIKKISSKNCVIDFIYNATPRIDFGGKQLDEIKIYAASNNVLGKLIKDIKLDHSYFGTTNTNKRLKLNSITTYSNNNTAGEKHTFDYNPIILPDYTQEYSNIADAPKFPWDYWGYYNGEWNNVYAFPDIIPGINNVIGMNYGSYRAPSESNMQACILTGIQYPTGGKTEFRYQSNGDNGFGGLRIESISNFTKNNELAQVKSYEYGFLSYIYNAWSLNETYKYSIMHNYFSQVQNPYEPFSMPCSHDEEWTHINASPLYSYNEIIGQATYYDSVTEIQGTGTSNIGRTEYSYQYPEIEAVVPESATTFRINDFDWGSINPLLKTQKEYKFGNANPIKILTNNYVKVKDQIISTGFKLINGKQYQRMGGDRDFKETYAESYVNSFIYQDSKAFSERYNLANTTIVETLSNGDIISKNINYTYNDLLQLKDETETINGKTTQTSYKYVSEFLNNPVNNSVYQSMYLNHLYTPLVETTVAVNGVQVSRQYNQYKDFATKMYKQELVQTQKTSDNPLETRIQFNKYGNTGNPVEFLKTNDVVNSYIWGYEGQYPIAKIENASYESIAQALGTTVSGLMNYNETNLGVINGLRSSLPNAMVTTYTFDPLIGITSMTDPKGYTTYYEYDEFNRLKQVKDAQSNILSKNEYHYKNQ